MASKIFQNFLKFNRTTALMATANVRNQSTKVPENLWKLGRLNHVAIATPDLPKSVSLYKDVMGASVR